MSDQTTTSAEPETRHRFTLPSAYTILFALIVLMAIATWLIPAGAYQLDKDGAPIPGTYHEVAGHPQRILIDSLTAPINGLYGIENSKGNISYYNNGTLFGAIDVALFIIVIGGFLGVTMATGAIQAGIGCAGDPAAGPGTVDDPDPDDRLRPRGVDVRHGRGEPRLLQPGHRRHDRCRVRRPDRRRDPPARLRDRHPGLDHQPVRDGNRLRVRRHLDQRRAPLPADHPHRRARPRDLLRDAVRRAGQAGPDARRWCTT